MEVPLRSIRWQWCGHRFGKRICSKNSFEPAASIAANDTAFSQLDTAPLSASAAQTSQLALVPGLYHPIAEYAPIALRKLRSNARPASFATNHLLMELLLTKSSPHLKPVDAFYDTPSSASDDAALTLESEIVDHAFSALCRVSTADRWELY